MAASCPDVDRRRAWFLDRLRIKVLGAGSARYLELAVRQNLKISGGFFTID